jgi:hypothetical protein
MAQPYQPPFPWPQTMEEAKSLKLTNAQVSLVVNKGQTKFDPEEGSFAIVDGFTFAQLEPGKIYLVSIADWSERELFNNLQLDYCDSIQCKTITIDNVSPHNLKRELVDLDGDGIDEIIAKDSAGGFEGNYTEPVYIYKIYKLTSGHSVDVSAQYRSYYESTLLPRMKADINAAQKQANGDPKELQVIDALATVAQDDYQRRVLRNPRAGLEHAKAWVHSENDRIQDYGFQELTKIDDPEAGQVLTRLKDDANPVIAKSSAFALQSWKDMQNWKSFELKQKQNSQQAH